MEMITLEFNIINDDVAQSLSNALAINTTLKTLNLASIQGITLTGWLILFRAIGSPNCVLGDLDLPSNDLNDAAMDSLTDALTHNMSLKSANLYQWRLDLISTAGWQRFFFTVLANPGSELEKRHREALEDVGVFLCLPTLHVHLT